MGIGVAKDDAQAVHWYGKAGELGDAGAINNLGVLYEQASSTRTMKDYERRTLKIQITFDTHNDNKNASTILHVFVKNRRPDTSTPIGPAGYITNHLACQFKQRPNFAGINEFLGCLENIPPGTAFDDPLPIRTTLRRLTQPG
jgi:hypothetical protein